MEPGRRKKMNNKIEAEAETQFPNVPEEIVVLILSKLPVKSLFQFRCVSKSWRSLISDPKFTLTTRRQVIVVPEYQICNDQYNRPDFTLHLIDDDEPSPKQLPRPEPLMHENLHHRSKRIRGSCNGLLLVNAGEDLFLWNPSTRSCNRVLSHHQLGKLGHEIVSGLCYDSSTDDYKALMAVINLNPPSVRDIMVGSFRNKTWTQIDFPYYRGRVESGPVVNQRLHWLVTDSSRQKCFLRPQSVVYFDPQTNEFVKVPMPQLKGLARRTVLGLGVLDGCLSMAIHVNNWIFSSDNMGDLEVLAMKKYGDNTSWTSLFIISNFCGLHWSDCLVPLRSTKNGDVLMHWRWKHTILAYNPKQNLCWDWEINIPIPIDRRFIDAAMFVESLASPSSYNWEEEEYEEIFLSGMTMKRKREQDDDDDWSNFVLM